MKTSNNQAPAQPKRIRYLHQIIISFESFDKRFYRGLTGYEKEEQFTRLPAIRAISGKLKDNFGMILKTLNTVYITLLS